MSQDSRLKRFIKAGIVLTAIFSILFIGWNNRPRSSGLLRAPPEVFSGALGVINVRLEDHMGAGIAGARIHADAMIVGTTDERGEVLVELEPGVHSVTARAPEKEAVDWFVPEAVDVHLTADAAADLVLVARQFGRISGQVLRDGRPVDARVELWPVGPIDLPVQTTKCRNGEFAFQNVHPGPVRLIASTDTSARARTPVLNIDDGESVADVEIALAADSARVTGSVKDSSGRPLEAYVTIDDGTWMKPVRARSNGTFEFSAVRPGGLRLTARGAGLRPRTMEIEVEAGEVGRADFVLDVGGSVCGTVSDPKNRTPERAWAVLLDADEVQAEVRTQADGTFCLDVEPGPGQAVQVIEPYHQSTARLPADSETLDLALGPGNFISGVVVTATGAAVSAFDIGVESMTLQGPTPYSASDLAISGYVSSDGSFAFGPLRPGKYWLRARAARHAPSSVGPIDISRGDKTTRIVLGKGGIVRGRVTSTDGAPLPRAKIALFDPMTPFDRQQTRTNSDGMFVLRGVPEGRRSIRVAARKHLTFVASGIQVGAAEEVTRDVTLTVREQGAKFEFHGIGAVLRTDDRAGIEVVEALEDKPAAIFGLQAGDRIVAIDKQDTRTMRLGPVVELIRGEEGVAVELEIERGDDRFKLEVERGRVVIK